MKNITCKKPTWKRRKLFYRNYNFDWMNCFFLKNKTLLLFSPISTHSPLNKYQVKVDPSFNTWPIYLILSKIWIFLQNPKQSFLPTFTCFSLGTISEKFNDYNFMTQNQKCWFWAQKCPIYPILDIIRIILKNPKHSLETTS